MSCGDSNPNPQLVLYFNVINMDKLLKYVDDSKYFGITKTEDDILLAQDKLNDLYGWGENNNMTWNALKFCVLRLGKNDEIKMNTCLLTPEF